MSNESRLASSLKCLFNFVCYTLIVYAALFLTFLVLENRIISEHKIATSIILIILLTLLMLIGEFSKEVINYENSSHFLREESKKSNPNFVRLYNFLRRFV